VSLKHAILTLLETETGSGYDLSKRFKGGLGYFWNASHQQIYQQLKKMLDEDLIECEIREQGDKPDKKIYSITEEGHTELVRWISDPVKLSKINDAFLIKLYAGNMVDAFVLQEELGINTTNLWIYPDRNHEKNVEQFLKDRGEKIPLVYVSFPSAKDPDWENRYPGKSTVEIVTLSHMDWFKEWDGTMWQQRGEEYEKYKDALAQKLLDKLFERMPQLKDALDFYELSTPLSTQFYQFNTKGEIYGLNHYTDRFEKSFLHPQTSIKNFYMTGVDVMTAGVGGGLMGGVMTTMNMLGWSGNKKVVKLFKEYETT
jgi:DNA-binding PadR family transcriptional regulator